MTAPGQWTLLTGHGHVLVEIARNPEARIRDLSAAAGITERTVQGIVADLEEAGYINRTRTGRRTVYTVNPDRPFRHFAQEGLQIGPLLDLLATSDDEAAATRGNRAAATQGNGDARNIVAGPPGPADDLRRR
jgi:DNA-binding HxlR family transcriptional regulator